MTDVVKQAIIINKGLKVRRGKEIAQGAHASMAWLTRRLEFITDAQVEATGLTPGQEAFIKGHATAHLSPAERAWVEGLFAKVTLQVDSAEELQKLEQQAKEAGLEAHLITDAGLTEFHGEPQITALGIGPDYSDRIDKITGELKLY